MITKDTVWECFGVFIRHSHEENGEKCDNGHVRIAYKLTEILIEYIPKAYTPTAYPSTM